MESQENEFAANSRIIIRIFVNNSYFVNTMEETKSKMAGLAVGLLIVGAVAGYYVGLDQGKKSAVKFAEEDAKRKAEEAAQATERVAAQAANPFTEAGANPLEDVAVNPLERIKFNPFAK